jgi:hypothetical protein
MNVFPPDHPECEGPLIFLAGPIQSATDWQSKAVDILNAIAPDIHVASPRRNVNFEGEFSKDMYNEQVDWETFHLRRAAKEGVVLFWLAKEDDHACHRAYAQTSRFEIGEWKERHCRDGSKLVVGIEEGFTGARYIRRRFSQDCPEVQICDSLQATCEAAVSLIRAPLGQFAVVE